MIRVTARRLDLHALDDGEEIRILTGTKDLRVLSDGCTGKVSANIAPTGVGERWIADGDLKNRWLSLTALAPLRMYWLTGRRADPGDSSSVVIHFRDITPSGPTAPEASNRKILGRRSAKKA